MQDTTFGSAREEGRNIGTEWPLQQIRIDPGTQGGSCPLEYILVMDREKTVPTELHDWVRTWREAGPALERVKRAELQRLETSVALQQLADAFEQALRNAPRTVTSGLVEQQQIFQRLRK